MEKISKLLEKIDTLPASPALLPRLVQALGDVDKTDVYAIVDIIVYDSGLTAKLLQLANSAYFGNSNPIADVGDAISQLGFEIVFMLAASISGAGCLKSAPGTGLDAEQLWKHSVISAFGTQQVAQAAKLDGSLAFTAGLLHDVGKVVLAESYGKIYTRMFEAGERGPMTLIAWETDNYGCNHADVGATLLENWKLPKPLVAAVKYHHLPAAADGNARLAACVCLGNAMAHAYENQTLAVDPANPEIASSLKITQLNINDIRTQWTQIQEKWQFVETLCALQK
jgi:putative nucleotidyltransferase with HDIG domain